MVDIKENEFLQNEMQRRKSLSGLIRSCGISVSAIARGCNINRKVVIRACKGLAIKSDTQARIELFIYKQFEANGRSEA